MKVWNDQINLYLAIFSAIEDKTPNMKMEWENEGCRNVVEYTNVTENHL